MSFARAKFYRSMNAIREIAEKEMLLDVHPLGSKENLTAQILRNGIAVSAFSLAETYLEDRIEEKIQELTSAVYQFSSFEPNLQAFILVDSIIGLASRIGFTNNKSERLKIAIDHAGRVAGALANPPRYTGLGFSPKGSNINVDDLKDALAAFGFQDCWRAMSTVCSAIGDPRPDPKVLLTISKQTRNSAAHDIDTNLSSSQLISHIEGLRTICMAFDIIFSHIIECYIANDQIEQAKINANKPPVRYRFIDREGDRYTEKLTSRKTNVASHATLDAALRAVCHRKAKISTIIRNERKVPEELI